MKLTPVIPALFTLAVATAPAPALEPPDASGIPARFQEVEPTIGDDPAAVGLRQLSVDLLQPNGFQNVYAVPGSPDEFMRIEGGLYAVFPRSEYGSSRFGTFPLIPSGTVFHIGAPPPEDALPSEALRPRASRVNTRLTRALNDTREVNEATERSPLPIAAAHADRPRDLSVTGRSISILNDMDYRHRRLTELMTRAATMGRHRADARRDAQPTAGTIPAAAAPLDDQAARGRSSSPSK
jgi:hypothetical protein